MLEAMHKKGAHEAFLDEFIPLLQQFNTREAHLALRSIETTINVLGDLSPERAQWYSKEALARLADAVQVALLYSFAEKSGERYAKLAQLYARRFLAGEPYPDWALSDQEVWWPFADHLMIPPDEKSVTSASPAG